MRLFKTALLLFSLSLAGNAFAGVYADAFAKKLVSSTTSAEKAVCVRWMFVAMSLHPDLKDMSSISPAQREAANKEFAELITKMLTVTCVDEAKEAIRYEGPGVIEQAFQLFGQVAGRELFTNQEVARGLAELQKYVNSEELSKVLTDAKAPAPSNK